MKILKKKSMIAIFLMAAFFTPPPIPELRADSMKPILSDDQVTKMDAFCYRTSQVISVLKTIQAARYAEVIRSGGQVPTGLLASLVAQGSDIANICQIVLAFGTATNTAGILSAAKQANAMMERQNSEVLSWMEDSLNMYQFGSNLQGQIRSDKKDGLTNAILNSNNWSYVLGQAQKYGVFTDGTDLANNQIAATEFKNSLDSLAAPLYSKCLVQSSPKVSKSELNEVELKNLSEDMEKARVSISGFENDIKHLKTKITNLLLKVESDGRKQAASYLIIDDALKSIHIRMTFDPSGIPQYSTNISDYTGAEKKDVDNPQFGAFSPEERKRKNIQQKISKLNMTKAYYKNQGRGSKSCSMGEDWLSWGPKNSGWLTDEYVRGKSLAEWLIVCPASTAEVFGKKIYLKDSPLASAQTEIVNQRLNERQQTVYCGKLKNAAFINDLNSLRQKGELSKSEWYFKKSGYSKKCTPPKLNIKTPYFDDREFSNFMGWRDHYSQKVYAFLKQEYGIDGAREAGSRFMESIDSGASSGMSAITMDTNSNQFKKAAEGYEFSDRATPQQERMNEALRLRDDNLCQVPSWFYEKYKDVKLAMDNPSFSEVKKREILEEGKARCYYNFIYGKERSNELLFSEYVNALIETQHALVKAHRTILSGNMKLGQYKDPSQSDKAQPGHSCLVQLTEQDATVLSAKILVMQTQMKLQFDMAEKLESEKKEAALKEKEKEEEVSRLKAIGEVTSFTSARNNAPEIGNLPWDQLNRPDPASLIPTRAHCALQSMPLSIMTDKSGKNIGSLEQSKCSSKR